MLATFQLVKQNEIISPILTTTKQYGIWFESVFGQYVAQQELYMRSTTNSGQKVLEWHPGTRIGNWFDKNIKNPQNWYIDKDSDIMKRLEKYQFADVKEAVSKIPDRDNYVLRLYTVEQIELYIKTCIDSKFDIRKYIGTSKQIKVKDSEMINISKPKTISKKNKLF